MLRVIEIIFILFSIVLIAKSLPIDDLQPKSTQNNVKIINYEFNQIPKVGYKYFYKLSDGQTKEEYGYYGENSELIVEGSYSYVVDDKTYTVNYFANKNGKQLLTGANWII